LLLVVPVPLALLHQAVAMLVLSVATVHAAGVWRRASFPLIPAQAGIQGRAQEAGSPPSRERAAQVL
jgi:hypothetical protein